MPNTIDAHPDPGRAGPCERAFALLGRALDRNEPGLRDVLRRALRLDETDAGAGRGARIEVRPVFRRQGDYWTVAFESDSTLVRDLRGLGYIAELLARPGERIHVAELAGGAAAEARAARPKPPDVPVVLGLGDAGPHLDSRARAEYRRRLGEIAAEIEEAESAGDTTRTGLLRREIDFIERALAAAFGRSGRPRRAADASERMRKAVTSRIQAALAYLRRRHPAVCAHFESALRLGTFCSYAPARTIAWQL